jgi:hypothetical protein
LRPRPWGVHVSISEFYVLPRVKLRFIMVHSWNRVAYVRPGFVEPTLLEDLLSSLTCST